MFSFSLAFFQRDQQANYAMIRSLVPSVWDFVCPKIAHSKLSKRIERARGPKFEQHIC